MNQYLDISPEVKAALEAGKPVVALESTIISHGMPYPKNVETALLRRADDPRQRRRPRDDRRDRRPSQGRTEP